MDVLENIKIRRPHLTKTERKFADFILAEPNRIYAPSISNLADQAGTSIATIQRFCLAIGYDGFSEFKFNVLDYLNSKEVDYSNKDWNSYLDTIKQLPSIFSQEPTKNLINSILNSRTTYVLGTHYSFSSAYELSTGLNDLGYQSIQVGVNNPIREQSLGHFIDSKSTIIVFSISGVKLIYPHLLKDSNFKNSNRTFLITMNKNAEMSKFFSQTILLPGNIANRNSVIDIQSIPIAYTELILNRLYSKRS
ncbi:MurR/RpiR family transcriptional regulator [Limosilactobacillus gastricus]|uniref:MurR/RpiR family transcriptional regulator n=1 Tax=Limosilactobacillus gastricus TaxID=227942 RepID=UPI0002D81B9E|nr:MurR/RpiR family transcriptional regulator [Limosilactobacillus gastricus]